MRFLTLIVAEHRGYTPKSTPFLSKKVLMTYTL